MARVAKARGHNRKNRMRAAATRNNLRVMLDPVIEPPSNIQQLSNIFRLYTINTIRRSPSPRWSTFGSISAVWPSWSFSATLSPTFSATLAKRITSQSISTISADRQNLSRKSRTKMRKPKMGKWVLDLPLRRKRAGRRPNPLK